jgi:hypothetical protein
MVSVLLSHAGEDAGLAGRIAAALRDAGAAPLSSRDVPAGADVDAWLNEVAGAADRVILLWSGAAAASPTAARETELAIRAWARGALVVARLDDAELPRGLRDIPAIDLGKPAADIGALVQRLLGRAPYPAAPAMAAAAAAAPPSPGPIPRSPTAFRPPRIALIGALAGLGIALGLVWLAVGSRHAPTASTPSPREVIQPLERQPPPRAPAPAAPHPGNSPGSISQPLPAEPSSRPVPAASAPPHKPDLPLTLIIAAAVIAAGVIAVAIFVAWRRRKPTVRSEAAADHLPPREMPRPAAPVADVAAEHEIFVSYSRHDEVVVDRIVEQLEGFGRRVWIDRQSGGHSGRYAAQIVAAIKSCQTIALMCSEHAFASDHVVREIYVAGDFRKPFIAFQLDSTEIPDELLYFLSGFPRIQSNDVNQAAIQSALARVLS